MYIVIALICVGVDQWVAILDHVSKLKKEMAEFQTQRDDELQRLNDFKNQETKRLKQDRKLFEAWQKQQQAAAAKKENQEIEGLQGSYLLPSLSPFCFLPLSSLLAF